MDKPTLRRQIRAARKQCSLRRLHDGADAITVQLLGLPEVREAENILLYLSVRREVPTDGLRAALSDKTLLIPRMDGDHFDAVHLVEPLRPGDHGIPTSDGPIHTGPIDVCIAPGLAFSPDGGRLGYGGGYYDRFFAAHDVGFVVALALPFQIVDQIPLEPHDRLMDAIVTPDRVIRR